MFRLGFMALLLLLVLNCVVADISVVSRPLVAYWLALLHMSHDAGHMT